MLGVPEDPLAVGTALPASADLNSYTTPSNYTADSTVIASITHAPTTTVEYKLTVEQISDDVIKQTVTTTETPANVYQRTGDSSSTDWVFGDWVKEIKSTDYATAGTGGQSGQPGIVKIGDGTVGIGLASNGELRTISASAGLIKAGTSDNRQISPMRQHEAVFYGLTKAAGVDMSASSNAIGTYTDEAKAAIQDMLDVPSNSDHASRSQHGLVKLSSAFQLNSYDEIVMSSPTSSLIKSGTSSYVGLTPQIQHESVFYGLAKASGDTTQSVSDNAVGVYTDDAKSAIQNMLGISDEYVTKDSIDNAGITDRMYVPVYGGEFTVTTAEAEGYDYPMATINKGWRPTYYSYRITFTDNSSNEVKEYIIPGMTWYNQDGAYSYLGNLSLYDKNTSSILDNIYTQCPFLIKERYDDPNYLIDIFTEQTGSYTFLVEKIEKTKTILSPELIYGLEYSPIKIIRNTETSKYLGTSIGLGNVINVPRNSFAIGAYNTINANDAIAIGQSNSANGSFSLVEGLNSRTSGSVAHSEGYRTIAGGMYSHSEGNGTQAMGKGSHSSGTYTKALGFSSNAIGFGTTANSFGMHAMGTNNIEDSIYPDWVSKTSYSIGDCVSFDGVGCKCIVENSDETFNQEHWQILCSNGSTAFVVGNGGVITGSASSNAYKVDWEGNGYYNGDVYVNCAADSTGGTKLISETDYATNTTAGIIKVDNRAFMRDSDGTFRLKNLGDNIYQFGKNTSNNLFCPVAIGKQYIATFYGLAEAAGDATQSSSSNAVGTYTENAKSAIRTMLGTVGAEDYATASTAGIVKVDSTNGVGIESGHKLYIEYAPSNLIKSGTGNYRPITPPRQHEAVFYGLAKAAGDVTQSVSSNTVGIYTTEAKAAIKSMLDISTPESVGSALQTVTGSSVVIVGEPNTRYVCGEVTSIDITPPSVGTIDVVFTSGSTVAVLTLPSTVKMPEWWTGVEAGYTYELVITDGTYAGVMSWAQ